MSRSCFVSALVLAGLSFLAQPFEVFAQNEAEVIDLTFHGDIELADERIGVSSDDTFTVHAKIDCGPCAVDFPTTVNCTYEADLTVEFSGGGTYTSEFTTLLIFNNDSGQGDLIRIATGPGGTQNLAIDVTLLDRAGEAISTADRKTLFQDPLPVFPSMLFGLVVGSRRGTTGAVTGKITSWELGEGSPPTGTSKDTCDTARDLGVLGATTLTREGTFVVDGTSVDPNGAVCVLDAPIIYDDWYKFTFPADGSIREYTLTVGPPSHDLSVSLYSARSRGTCANLDCVASLSADDSILNPLSFTYSSRRDRARFLRISRPEGVDDGYVIVIEPVDPVIEPDPPAGDSCETQKSAGPIVNNLLTLTGTLDETYSYQNAAPCLDNGATPAVNAWYLINGIVGASDAAIPLEVKLLTGDSNNIGFACYPVTCGSACTDHAAGALALEGITKPDGRSPFLLEVYSFQASATPYVITLAGMPTDPDPDPDPDPCADPADCETELKEVVTEILAVYDILGQAIEGKKPTRARDRARVSYMKAQEALDTANVNKALSNLSKGTKKLEKGGVAEVFMEQIAAAGRVSRRVVRAEMDQVLAAADCLETAGTPLKEKVRQKVDLQNQVVQALEAAVSNSSDTLKQAGRNYKKTTRLRRKVRCES